MPIRQYVAKSPSHQLGEKIGVICEDFLAMKIVRDCLEDCENQDYYLDYKHKREARGGKKLVLWEDGLGNSHRLDLVIEQSGTEKKMGELRAIIEVGWRRYTKHSKAKAQEIQGAVNPVVEKYRHLSPYKGVIIIGDWTKPSIEQLGSEGFAVLHFTTKMIFDCIKENAGFDISFVEETKEKDLLMKAEKFDNITDETRENIVDCLLKVNGDEVSKFKKSLRSSLDRKVTKVEIQRQKIDRIEFESLNSAIAGLSEEKFEFVEAKETYRCVVEFNSEEYTSILIPDLDSIIKVLQQLDFLYTK